MSKKTFHDVVGHSEHVAHLLPNSLTDAGFWFLLQASRITVTFHSYQWMSKFVSSSEWMVEDYAEYLKVEGGPFESADDGQISFYQTIMLQMIWADEIHLSKIIDLLISYFVDLIACAYRADPGLIPSKSRFDLNFVRKFKTINDAVRGSALVEIERVSKSGFPELLAEARRVANCELATEVDFELRQLVKLRNDIVHGQGSHVEIINSMFNKKRKTKSWFKHKPGDTARAEVLAATVVGIFEEAAIKAGVYVAATKSEIFENDKQISKRR